MDDQQANRDVQLLNAGDAGALQRLIVHCHGPLQGVVAAALGADLHHRLDPADVLQEAYAKAFLAAKMAAPPAQMATPPAQNRPAFDNPGHFYKWLEAIALNQLRDMQTALRRQKRDARREAAAAGVTDSYPSLIQQLAGSDPTPSRVIQKDEAIAAVLSSLARLDEEQRQVIRLRFLQEVPFEQIAERLGKSVEATYMICHRGLKNLRGYMVSITHYLTDS